MRQRYLSLIAAAALMLGAVSQAGAAESLDAAVESIAQKFVASVPTDGEPARIAVTAFAQSDQKQTQFSNLLMIALTGKMVQVGSGKLKVIERAQLETALVEIQLSDVPIFDRSTARELGKFLGVNRLIVGEITPLADAVRLDARMIDVETIETIAQAYEWVPLTPTVQRQLDTAAMIARPRVGDGSAPPDLGSGIWRGTGTCGNVAIGLAVSMIVTPDNKISAMQSYYPVAASGDVTSVQTSGTLTMAGTINPASGELTLLPGSWINQPRGHGSMGFTGKMDLGTGVITANYDLEGCGALTLNRMN